MPVLKLAKIGTIIEKGKNKMMKNKVIKMSFIIVSILLIVPSIIYLVQNKTLMGFYTYYNFFINKEVSKIISTSIYLVLYIIITIIYIKIISKKEIFKDIKQILKYVALISIIFGVMLPWTSSDIFYYMGVGELDSEYNQNPYYITMKEYYNENQENIDDTILEQGSRGYWANTTVVYGPIAQFIFKICTSISFKNIDICFAIFKIVNIVVHLVNCYLIYKLSNKKFAIIYGINPFILLEFIGNVHNDIIVVFFILLTIYFVKNKKLILSIISLALATGIKYFTILLLPIVILYYFKEEKSIGKRFLRCIQYGLIFLVIFILEYALYFRDFNVLLAMFAQTSKYSKSLYSAIMQQNQELMQIIKFFAIVAFIWYYIKLCIDLLTEKNIKFFKIIRKYNIALVLFMLILTSFQQWYLLWLFATIMWQKARTIRNIIGLTAAAEIANSIYMFKSEWYIYDAYFVGGIVCLFIIWQMLTKFSTNNYSPINKQEENNG